MTSEQEKILQRGNKSSLIVSMMHSKEIYTFALARFPGTVFIYLTYCLIVLDKKKIIIIKFTLFSILIAGISLSSSPFWNSFMRFPRWQQWLEKASCINLEEFLWRREFAILKVTGKINIKDDHISAQWIPHPNPISKNSKRNSTSDGN